MSASSENAAVAPKPLDLDLDLVLDPRRTPTVTVPVAAQVLGISRATAYEGVAAGTIPSVRIGRRLLVPVAAIRRLLQLDEPP